MWLQTQNYRIGMLNKGNVFPFVFLVSCLSLVIFDSVDKKGTRTMEADYIGIADFQAFMSMSVLACCLCCDAT
jgi:hypothetical protein